MANTKRKVTKQKADKKKRQHTKRKQRRFGELLVGHKVAISLLLIAVFSLGFYWFFVRPYSYRWKPCYGRLAYGVCIPSSYDVHGIDISHYQGKIDWRALGDTRKGDFPLRFVFIKATEGGDLSDATFQQNFDSAHAYGFVRGAYHFFVPQTDALRQADFFIRKVRLQPGDLAPVLDVETIGRKSKEELQMAVKQWLLAVEQYYGVKPIIYTSYKFKERYLNDSIINSYPYWIAHYYVDTVRYSGHWEFWQHTDVGTVPGIDHEVDLNVFNGSLSDLNKYVIP